MPYGLINVCLEFSVNCDFDVTIMPGYSPFFSFDSVTFAILFCTCRLHPAVIWAQRVDKIYLTINVEDCKSPEIKMEPNAVYFK